jgi:hypothetical protein
MRKGERAAGVIPARRAMRKTVGLSHRSKFYSGLGETFLLGVY